MSNIRPGKHLVCGCCGINFVTWKGYVDQDQDKGYGICEKCQGWIEERDEQEWDKSIKVLREALNEDNRKQFDEMDRDTKKALVSKAILEGVITFSIGRR